MTRAAAAALLVLLPLPAGAQRPADVVRWSAAPLAASVRPGGTVTIGVTAEIDEGWHVYAITQPKGSLQALAVSIARSEPFDVNTTAIEGPVPTVSADPVTSQEAHYYTGKVTLHVPVSARRGARPGRRTVPIDIAFQACDIRICLRPATATVPVNLTVTGR